MSLQYLRSTQEGPSDGQVQTRAEWIKSGNSDASIRWALDYRCVNSQTDIPKIPQPRIDELFDRMQGCKIFSIIDLAQGYHYICRSGPRANSTLPSGRPLRRTIGASHRWA